MVPGKEIFGNSRIVEMLDCSETTATKYINRMYEQLKITVVVECFLRVRNYMSNSKKGGLFMSNKERVVELLDNVPEYKMGYVLAYVQGITADEEADDIFCQRMIENYENAPDDEKEDIPLDECLREWGID